MPELPVENVAAGETADLAALANLDEKILLNELKVRFHNQRIYTYVGDILVALNPYQDIGLYTKEHIKKYKHAARGEHPPHIYAISDSIYQAMTGRHGHVVDHQCVLISGESGAGKTESTKLLIQQIMELVHGNVQLEQQILQVNPLLEAFGNAQTVMNNNSSRFGKYILLKFHKGQVIGAKISEYLLEKSRLTRQSQGEQNFHIFYYMLAGFSEEEKKKYCMGSYSSYKYFCDQDSGFNAKRPQLKAGYDELLNAMDMVGFSEEEQTDMFKILSGAISFGNVVVTENDDGAAVIEKSRDFDIATSLTGLDSKELLSVLTCNITYAAGEEIKKNYTQAQSIDACDALAKMLYGRLFSWIVNKINTLLAQQHAVPNEDVQQIGILDIFGFENLEHNSFEQACINLANEQLQFFFNKHIFMLEQEEYKKEGVNWNEIKFVDNQDLLDLFLARPIGILALLDEESVIPKGNDVSFVNKMDERFKKKPHYIPKKGSNEFFAISHYAGKVDYNSIGWLDKNRDTLVPGTMQVLKSSTNDLVKLIFRAKISRTGTLALQNRIAMSRHSNRSSAAQNKEGKLTVGKQFQNSLQVLMEQMSAARPVFVRCIKPNNDKKPKLFDDKYVESQLLYTGMLETTKIRREGYAVRPTFQEFVEKYQILSLTCSMPHTAKSCEKLLKQNKITKYQIGKTKVFLKYYHIDALSDRMVELGKAVVFMQKGVRGFLDRRKVVKMRAEAKIQKEKMERFLSEIAQIKINSLSQQNAARMHDLEMQNKKKEEMELAMFPPPPPPEELAAIEVTEFPEPPPPAHPETNMVEVPTNSGIDDGEILPDDFPPPALPVSRPSQSSRAGGVSRAQTVKWFQQSQMHRIRQTNMDTFAEWFHGIITRREAERLLNGTVNGCFLIRVSESRFGYSLSFRDTTRCRHYMIDLTASGKYVIVGEPKVHRTLHDMVEYHQKYRLSNWDGLLTDPCGQEDGQCDYAELVDRDMYLYPQTSVKSSYYSNNPLPPPIPDRSTRRRAPQPHGGIPSMKTSRHHHPPRPQ